MISLTLRPAPLSTNHIYRVAQNRIYMTAEGRSLKEAYQWQAKSQWKKPSTTKPVALTLFIYYGDNRKHDIDNNNKLVLDALTGIVYKDDGQIFRLFIYKRFDANDPRVDIDVQELA